MLLQRVDDDAVVAGVLEDAFDARAGHLAEPRSMVAPELGDSTIATPATTSDPKTNASSGSRIPGSRYTSILMTWRIHTNPIVCMTIAPMSIIWPMCS